MDDIFEVMELNKESCLFKVKKTLLNFLPMQSIKIKHIFKKIHVMNYYKNNFYFSLQSEDSNLFKLWLQNVKQQTLDLGAWRKRRNALPNIMIKHLVWLPVNKKINCWPFLKGDLRLRAKFSHMRKPLHIQLHTCHVFFVMWHAIL